MMTYEKILRSGEGVDAQKQLTNVTATTEVGNGPLKKSTTIEREKFKHSFSKVDTNGIEEHLEKLKAKLFQLEIQIDALCVLIPDGVQLDSVQGLEQAGVDGQKDEQSYEEKILFLKLNQDLVV